MNAPTVDTALSELIQHHYDKIKAISPLNPSISKDDEWRDDTCWDIFDTKE